MRRNGDRGLVGGDREILDRGYGFHRTGDRWLPDRWLGMPSQGPVTPPVTEFDPTTIPGLKTWLKADAITVADGAKVATWPDSSPAHNNAQNATVAQQPSFAANVINGKPVVRFNSTIQTMLDLVTPVPVAPAFTVFTVMQAKSPADSMTGIGDVTYSNRAQSVTLQASTGIMKVANGFGSFSATPTGMWGFHMYSTQGRDSDNFMAFWVDGVSKALTGVDTGGVPASFTRLGLWATVAWCNGDIAETLIYDSILSDTDRKAVEDYLNKKYAISQQPTSVPGLKGWWAADKIATTGLREAWEKRAHADQNPAGLPEPKDGVPDARITDGAPVATWPDASGNGKNFVATYGPPPTYVAAGVNGKPIVRLLADGLHVMDANSFSVNQPDTIIVVAKKPNISTQGVLVDNAAADGITGQIFMMTPGNSYLAAGARGIDVANELVDSTDHHGAFHVFMGVFNGASSSLWVDGVQTAAGPMSGVGLNTLRIQCDRTGAWPSEIDMAEVLVYDHVLSTYERIQLEGYLGSKYGITVPVPEVPQTVPGLRAWYKADAITVGSLLRDAWESRDKAEIMPADFDPKAAPADGAHVSGWVDSGGLNFHMSSNVQQGGTYKANAINGKPSVSFDGVIQGFYQTSDLGAGFPDTIFIVAKQTSKATHAMFVRSGNQTVFCTVTNGNFLISAGTNGNDNKDHSGAFHVFTARFEQVTTNGHVDGVQVIAPFDSYQYPSVQLYLGYDGGSQFLSGEIAEVLLYKGRVSDSDKQKIESYLMSKYGITTPTAPPPFDPLSITGCKLWLKADAITSPGLIIRRPGEQPVIVEVEPKAGDPRAITDGDLLNVWQDFSGLNWSFYAVDATRKPIYKASVINGKPAVHFDGASYLISNGAIAGITNAVSVFIVSRTVAMSNAPLWGDGSGNPNNCFHAYMPFQPDSKMYFDFGDSASAGRVSNYWGADTTNFFVWSFIAGGGSMSILRNGAVIASNASAVNNFDGSAMVLQLGMLINVFVDCYVTEMLIYNHVLTITDRQAVESYLKTKYAITGSRDVTAKDVVKLVGKILVTGELPPPPE